MLGGKDDQEKKRGGGKEEGAREKRGEIRSRKLKQDLIRLETTQDKQRRWRRRQRQTTTITKI